MDAEAVCCHAVIALFVDDQRKKEELRSIQHGVHEILRAKPSISMDIECGMGDESNLDELLKDVTVCDEYPYYSLYRIDIGIEDMHWVQRVGRILKRYELLTEQDPVHWRKEGVIIDRIWAFHLRERTQFALVVKAEINGVEDMATQQVFYEQLRSEVDGISISIGVTTGCNKDYHVWRDKANEAMLAAKQNGDGIKVWHANKKKLYPDFHAFRANKL